MTDVNPRPDGSRSDPQGSFAARLTQKYGAGVDPQVSLDRAAQAPDSAPSGASSELLRRLSEHSLKESRYKLQGEIARGGMGAIFRVWDEDLRRALAMKVILGQADSRVGPAVEGGTPAVDTRTLGRFLEEAQITGQLDHPGIVPVHELGLDGEGRVYFTMKLVKGRDLQHVFELVFAGKEGWNETRALSVILRACEAMAYAHKKGVIHRDLKPANVMVGDFGEVFVMDWGLARVLDQRDRHDLRLAPESANPLLPVRTARQDERAALADSPIVTIDGDVMGTPAYMSPEQARGEIEKLGPRADVYSMGALLYHLLARRAPYTAPGRPLGNHAVLALVRSGPPAKLTVLRSDVPAELAAIVEKAMAREASQRYSDTLALAEDLRAYLEHRVVGAYETGAFAEAKKWVERNKSLAASLAGAIVLLVGGLTTSLVFKARADENAETATQKANDVLSLSAIQELKELVERADALWPAHPENIAAYDLWLADAKVLIDGRAADSSRGLEAHPSLADHESKLAEIRLRAKALPAGPLEGGQRTYAFDSAQDRWWHAQLAQLVSDLMAFTDEEGGGLCSSGTSTEHGWGIVKRAEFARTIEDRSVAGADARRRWNEAIASIQWSARYGGLELTPQLGLLPIGEDSESHLWEFTHLQTGTVPERGADGKLVLTESIGMVFVLIPGGAFMMGAQGVEPTRPNYDPQARSDESPVHEVTLSPYFLSKYEMTQGQWLRFVGRNPSNYGPGSDFAGHRHNLLHPVEQVSWTQCVDVMTRLGLSLPSEAQWENGCRGGTDTPWSTGVDRESLRHKVNLPDQSAAREGAPWQDIKDWPDLDDGWAIHATIGSFSANMLGLHEVHGNVWEWCTDGYDAGFYGRSPTTDPIAPTGGDRSHVYRGGGFSHAAAYARSAFRDSHAPESQFLSLGLRPAKGIATR